MRLLKISAVLAFALLVTSTPRALADDGVLHPTRARLYELEVQDQWDGVEAFGFCKESQLARDPLASKMSVLIEKPRGQSSLIPFVLADPLSCAHSGFNTVLVELRGELTPTLAKATVEFANAKFQDDETDAQRKRVTTYSFARSYSAVCAAYKTGWILVDIHLRCELANQKGHVDFVLE